MRPLKVSEVNNYIKRLFSSDLLLPNVTIEGEISNFTHHYSGHMYFSLKDDSGKIRSVMFKSDNSKLNIKLDNGMNIVATGYISLYEKEGDYQFYIRFVKESKEGDLFKKFELLKEKLNDQGLFDPKYKKALPKYPKKIGVVTSATGAAVRDIITVIKRRYPLVDILICPASVQGENSSKEIIRGLKILDERDDIDLIIFGRGGGSMEELFSFNDEDLAKTIFSLKKPSISAVGHEIDFTISDFVADLRAATPSAGAELAVPNIEELFSRQEDLVNKLNKHLEFKINDSKYKLDRIARKLEYVSPILNINNKKQNLDILYVGLIRNMENFINAYSKKTLELEKKLISLNPTLALDKGHGLIVDSNGHGIDSVKLVKENDEIKIILKDGLIRAKVILVEEE